MSVVNKLGLFLKIHRRYFFSVLLLVVIFSTVFFVEQVFAQDITGALNKTSQEVNKATQEGNTGWLIDIMKAGVNIATQFAGWILTFAMPILTLLLSFDQFFSLPMVNNGWQVMRDLSNMVFIIILMIIAFSTILRIQTFHYKQALVKLLIMAVLINFSKTIAGVLIEFGQVIMLSFVDTFQGSVAGNILQAFKIVDMLALTDQISTTSSQSFVVGAYLLTLMMLFYVIGVVFNLVVVLAKRIIFLFFLIALSPLAYVANVISPKYWSQYWEMFFKNLFYGPLVAIMLWMVLSTVQALPDGGIIPLIPDSGRQVSVQQRASDRFIAQVDQATNLQEMSDNIAYAIEAAKQEQRFIIQQANAQSGGNAAALSSALNESFTGVRAHSVNNFWSILSLGMILIAISRFSGVLSTSIGATAGALAGSAAKGGLSAVTGRIGANIRNRVARRGQQVGRLGAKGIKEGLGIGLAQRAASGRIQALKGLRQQKKTKKYQDSAKKIQARIGRGKQLLGTALGGTASKMTPEQIQQERASIDKRVEQTRQTRDQAYERMQSLGGAGASGPEMTQARADYNQADSAHVRAVNDQRAFAAGNVAAKFAQWAGVSAAGRQFIASSERDMQAARMGMSDQVRGARMQQQYEYMGQEDLRGIVDNPAAGNHERIAAMMNLTQQGHTSDEDRERFSDLINELAEGDQAVIKQFDRLIAAQNGQVTLDARDDDSRVEAEVELDAMDVLRQAHAGADSRSTASAQAGSRASTDQTYKTTQTEPQKIIIDEDQVRETTAAPDPVYAQARDFVMTQQQVTPTQLHEHLGDSVTAGQSADYLDQMEAEKVVSADPDNNGMYRVQLTKQHLDAAREIVGRKTEGITTEQLQTDMKARGFDLGTKRTNLLINELKKEGVDGVNQSPFVQMSNQDLQQPDQVKQILQKYTTTNETGATVFNAKSFAKSFTDMSQRQQEMLFKTFSKVIAQGGEGKQEAQTAMTAAAVVAPRVIEQESAFTDFVRSISAGQLAAYKGLMEQKNPATAQSNQLSEKIVKATVTDPGSSANLDKLRLSARLVTPEIMNQLPPNQAAKIGQGMAMELNNHPTIITNMNMTQLQPPVRQAFAQSVVENAQPLQLARGLMGARDNEQRQFVGPIVDAISNEIGKKSPIGEQYTELSKEHPFVIIQPTKTIAA